MRWELSAEQTDFRAVLAEWLGETCASETLRGWLDSGDHAGFDERYVADGWFGVGSAEDLGGEGGGLVELALAAEEQGRVAAPASSWLGSMVALGVLAELPEMAKAVLAGGATTVLAVPAGTVPTGGSRDGERGVVERGSALVGTVSTVLAAARAHRLVVPVPGVDGPVLHVVDVEQPGVRIRRRALTDRSRTVADVEFAAAQSSVVPVADASAALEAASLRAAVLVAADSLGVMEHMLEATVEYVQQRRQFGVPIGSFQAVKHAAAEMLVKVEAARSIVYLAAASVESGHPDAALHAAAAKAQACSAGAAAADSALTLHGAIGYTWEHDLQIFYKRAKLDAELFGSPSAWNARLADLLELVPGV
jgi:alkylation response protein AidB-like acyl-CoA dehydrogenase